MKKISKKIVSVFITFALLLFVAIQFMPITVVHADPENITIQLDGAPVSNNVITFNVGGTDVTATVSGSGYSWSNGNLVITSLNDVHITMGSAFDGTGMQVKFNDQVATITGEKEVALGDVDFSQDNAPHMIVLSTGGGPASDDTSNHQGNATATLNYSINGVIEYTSGGGYDHGITFKINDIRYKADESKMVYTESPAYERDDQGQLIYNGNNELIPVKDPEGNPMTEITSLTITGDTIHYDADSNKVNFTFMMAPGTLMTGLVINGQTIDNLPKTAEDLWACYVDHNLEIPINGIDKADTYTIAITARFPDSSEEFMGNFLWDYNPEGYTGPDDKILNATLEFVSAEYDGHTYTTPEEVNNLGGIYIWKDAPRKKTYTDEREGCGEAQFPKGTILTVKIIPDSGYQLVSFGVNGGVFEPQETIGTYTFTVGSGPFHLQASIQQVSDVVHTTSDSISRGTIDLGEEESMAIGTARLDVKDIDLTEDQISDFEEAAGDYTIKNYIDISLFNTVYKGTSSQSWDTQVKDLTNDATIALKLEDYADIDDIVIVHEKHDGTYEIIPIAYDAENNMITFKTKSFSNYAIATKTLNEIEYTVKDSDGNEVTFTDPEGKNYTLTIIDYLSIPKEELLSTYNVPEEEYDMVMNAIKEKTSSYGEFVGFFEIMLFDENGNEVHDGPFNIKIKMTDFMKNYNTFKIIYLDDQLNIEEPITLTAKDGYLVGTIPHLSKYVITGSVTTVPKTYDGILRFVVMFVVSTIGLLLITLHIKKKRTN